MKHAVVHCVQQSVLKLIHAQAKPLIGHEIMKVEVVITRSYAVFSIPLESSPREIMLGT